MSKISKILLLLVFVLASGCATEMEGYRYLPTVNNAGKNTYGGWIVATVVSNEGVFRSETVAGELISAKDHVFYILDPSKMHIIPESRISEATLYLYRKQPGIFAIITIIGVLPNIIAAFVYPEYSDQFLALGIPALIFGLTFTFTEAANTRNQLRYPEKIMLNQFGTYARFPQGIPAGLDTSQLKLPYVK
jgi:hypothetical protein